MVIIIQSVFAILYLLLKRAVLSFYKNHQAQWQEIQPSYYWVEYTYFFTATVVTPKHSYNEGIITLVVVLLIKLIMDKILWIDEWFDKLFNK